MPSCNNSKSMTATYTITLAIYICGSRTSCSCNRSTTTKHKFSGDRDASFCNKERISCSTERISCNTCSISDCNTEKKKTYWSNVQQQLQVMAFPQPDQLGMFSPYPFAPYAPHFFSLQHPSVRYPSHRQLFLLEVVDQNGLSKDNFDDSGWIRQSDGPTLARARS
ncbi:hypothetical protein AKJ16_DCAP08150 [Drosera capensis]